MPAVKTLPQFIPPMLAVQGEPFDSDEHLFEIKWDGTRALTFVDRPGAYRMLNRRRVDLTSRYPEFSFLADLPAGTVLDGEVVVLKQGKPGFAALQSREHARKPVPIPLTATSCPASYIVFDLLYARYRPIMDLPLRARRSRLARLVRRCNHPLLLFSEGIVGHGTDYFQAVCQQGLEGMMAKRLAGRYVPGKRTGAWTKIKQSHTMLCAIIGFLPDGPRDFRSLLLACEQDGKPVYVGRVSSGIDEPLRARLNELLWRRLSDNPVIPCAQKARWVEPEVYCTVRYLERTPGGQLRSPVFVEVCHGD